MGGRDGDDMGLQHAPMLINLMITWCATGQQTRKQTSMLSKMHVLNSFTSPQFVACEN